MSLRAGMWMESIDTVQEAYHAEQRRDFAKYPILQALRNLCCLPGKCCRAYQVPGTIKKCDPQSTIVYVYSYADRTCMVLQIRPEKNAPCGKPLKAPTVGKLNEPVPAATSLNPPLAPPLGWRPQIVQERDRLGYFTMASSWNRCYHHCSWGNNL
jgi:hypothetical protein